MASPDTVVVSGGLAAGFRSASVPASTRAAYAGDWAKFTAWCSQEDHVTLPADPGVVGEYLAQSAALVADKGGFVYAPATLARLRGHRSRRERAPRRHEERAR